MLQKTLATIPADGADSQKKCLWRICAAGAGQLRWLLGRGSKSHELLKHSWKNHEKLIFMNVIHELFTKNWIS